MNNYFLNPLLVEKFTNSPSISTNNLTTGLCRVFIDNNGNIKDKLNNITTNNFEKKLNGNYLPIIPSDILSDKYDNLSSPNDSGYKIYDGLIKFPENGNYRFKIKHHRHMKIIISNNIIYDTASKYYILNKDINQVHYCYVSNVFNTDYYPITIILYPNDNPNDFKDLDMKIVNTRKLTGFKILNPNLAYSQHGYVLDMKETLNLHLNNNDLFYIDRTNLQLDYISYCDKLNKLVFNTSQNLTPIYRYDLKLISGNSKISVILNNDEEIKKLFIEDYFKNFVYNYNDNDKTIIGYININQKFDLYNILITSLKSNNYSIDNYLFDYIYINNLPIKDTRYNPKFNNKNYIITKISYIINDSFKVINNDTEKNKGVYALSNLANFNFNNGLSDRRSGIGSGIGIKVPVKSRLLSIICTCRIDNCDGGRMIHKYIYHPTNFTDYYNHDFNNPTQFRSPLSLMTLDTDYTNDERNYFDINDISKYKFIYQKDSTLNGYLTSLEWYCGVYNIRGIDPTNSGNNNVYGIIAYFESME